jgi:hypothetical protein
MVYIQSDSERKLPHHFDAACALYGALDNGQNIRLTSIEEIQSGKFDPLIRKHLFAGSVEFMQEVFNRINISVPAMAPSQSFTLSTIREVREQILNGKKLFIKPTKIKLFSGMIYDLMTLSNLNPYPEDTDVFVIEPFKHKIISEWRCYVKGKTIIDSRNYSGDFKISPKYNWVENILKTLDNYPSTYTIDIGILENDENVVIEFNDMWAIGNYGIDNIDYYKLLRERYFEIMNDKKYIYE